MLAAALHESGASEAAEEQLGRVLEAQPDAAPAHVALGEALLSQSRFAEAAEAAAPSTAESPWAPAAARTAVFGLPRRGGRRRRRPRRPGLGPRGRAAGGRGPRDGGVGHRALRHGAEPASVPAGGARLTLTMLEALLRLQAFELFAQLLPVVDALALTARDRHEQLARVYLRRGYLESAGDEWVAAIQENGPDVAALMGLSQVAAARGLDEDAELLAGEARALATA